MKSVSISRSDGLSEIALQLQLELELECARAGRDKTGAVQKLPVQLDMAATTDPVGSRGTGSARVGNLGDLAGAQAAGAHVDALGRTVDERSDPLNVRIPTTLGADVGVADTHAERRLLAANFANRCHVEILRVVAPKWGQ